MLIVKTGTARTALADADGDFEDWIGGGLGRPVQVCSVFEGDELPAPSRHRRRRRDRIGRHGERPRGVDRANGRVAAHRRRGGRAHPRHLFRAPAAGPRPRRPGRTEPAGAGDRHDQRYPGRHRGGRPAPRRAPGTNRGPGHPPRERPRASPGRGAARLVNPGSPPRLSNPGPPEPGASSSTPSSRPRSPGATSRPSDTTCRPRAWSPIACSPGSGRRDGEATSSRASRNSPTGIAELRPAACLSVEPSTPRSSQLISALAHRNAPWRKSTGAPEWKAPPDQKPPNEVTRQPRPSVLEGFLRRRSDTTAGARDVTMVGESSPSVRRVGRASFVRPSNNIVKSWIMSWGPFIHVRAAGPRVRFK